jgi:hypothetical protein
LIVDLRAGSAADETVLEDLESWLTSDFDLRGAVRRNIVQPRTGEMGAVSDVLSVALASGGAVTALAASLRVWFAQPRRSDVRLKVTTAQGETIELDARRIDNAEAILKVVLTRETAVQLPAEGDDGAAAS